MNAIDSHPRCCSHALALAAVLLLALALRIPLAGHVPPGLWYDEALDLQDAAAVWGLPGGPLPGHGLQWVYPDVFPRETLYTSTLALATRLVGPHEGALRWVSVGFGLLTVGLLFGMLRASWGTAPALVAAAVLATLRWHATFSVLIFRTITLPALLVGLTWAVLAWQRRPSAARALLVGALAGLGFHTYLAWYFMAPYVAALLGWMLWPRPAVPVDAATANEAPAARRFAPASHLAALALGLLAVAGPLALHYLHHPEHLLARPQAVSVFAEGWHAAAAEVLKNTRDVLLMFHWRGDHVPKHNIPWRPALDALQGLGLLGGLLACAQACRRSPGGNGPAPGSPGPDRPGPGFPGRPLAVLLPLWMACGLLATIFTKTDSPNTLRTLCITPAVAALVALGYVRAAAWLARIWVTRTAASNPTGAERLRALRLRQALLLVLFIATSGAITAQDLYRRWARDERVWQSFNGDIYQLGRLAASAPAGAVVFVPQFLWQHRTFQYLTLRAPARIYPYAAWNMLAAWPPSAPADALGEGPAELARSPQPAGPQPRERWILVTAHNQIMQTLEQLTPGGHVAAQLKAPAGNTWALAWVVPEDALPPAAALAPLAKWPVDLRF